ncbi:cell filamentation protein Fic (plasmid) [Acetobacter aceti 1023]|nr:cell filamentation protein Fic [Acetobacter aceti 1023]
MMPVTDLYLYPDTDVLVNKKGYQNADRLRVFETTRYLSRAITMPTATSSPSALKNLHHHLFQDVYDWAGQYRTCNLSVDGRKGLHPQSIHQSVNAVFQNLNANNGLQDLSSDRFARAAATHIASLDKILPFRHGNQQVTLLHLAHLARNAGHTFDLSQLDHDQWNRASSQAAVNDERLMTHAIASLFKSGRTITPDQARREALSLRDPARHEIQSRIEGATRILDAGRADGTTLKELRGLRGELKALESDTQVGTVLRHIDQAQKAGIEKLTVLPGRDGSARDAIYAIGRAAVRSLDLREDQRAAQGMKAEQAHLPSSWFTRASQKLSASEGTAPQSNGPKSRGPQIG